MTSFPLLCAGVALGLAASDTSNLGAFSYTGSHCIAGFPPGPYTDGLFTWDFGDGTLAGTYTGLLSTSPTPGQFLVSENILFTGGTGRFDGGGDAARQTGAALNKAARVTQCRQPACPARPAFRQDIPQARSTTATSA